MSNLDLFRTLLVVSLVMTISAPGLGQRPALSERPVLDVSRFSIEAGGYLANVSSNIRLGAEELGLGLDIDFEQALGLETTALTYYGSFTYRFSKNRRHGARVRYFEITRSATKVLAADIEIRDLVFTVGTEMGSSFSLRVINTDYSYAFLQDERVRISGSFGLFIMPMRFSFRADDNKETFSDFVAPLPAFGLDSYFLLSRKFSLNQGIHIFYLRIDKVEGRMTDLYVNLEYKPIPRLGVGFGFNSFNIDIRQEKDAGRIFGGLVGNVGYRQSGMLLFAAFDF